eukprot:TRINITY_DN69607_c0_g1_i1.p1 TRINITY_DN69607_c0_g1~~TRINITY_DN69607_c0_g1_i1.p1  ORF type:complete len:848 (+),score=125.51 TRINITY_DN69607_c0_g1_i1:98-2641(+)
MVGGQHNDWGPTAEATLTVAAALLAAVSLTGCTNTMETHCPSGWPAVVDFKPDVKELYDMGAPCRYLWNPFLGTPCASQVPAPLGRQGKYWEFNMDWAISNLNNGLGKCTDKQTSDNNATFCRSWIFKQTGCKRDILEMCSCKNDQNGLFCTNWECSIVSVEHRTCWEANLTGEPALTCDVPGSDPSPLVAEDVESFVTDSRGRDAFLYNTACFSTRQVTDSTWAPSSSNKACESGWRLVRLHDTVCECGSHRADGNACKAWQCNSGDSSKKTAAKQSWQSQAVCTEDEKTTGPGSLGPGVQCSSWHSRQDHETSVQVSQCRASGKCSLGVGVSFNCDGEWSCTSYILPRLPEVIWGVRFAFALLHSLWLTLFAAAASSVTVSIWLGTIGLLGRLGLSLLLPWPLLAWLVWSIGFLRADDGITRNAREGFSETTERAPFPTFGGLLLVAFCSYVTVISALEVERWRRHKDPSRTDGKGPWGWTVARMATSAGAQVSVLLGFVDCVGFVGALLGALLIFPLSWFYSVGIFGLSRALCRKREPNFFSRDFFELSPEEQAKVLCQAGETVDGGGNVGSSKSEGHDEYVGQDNDVLQDEIPLELVDEKNVVGVDRQDPVSMWWRSCGENADDNQGPTVSLRNSSTASTPPEAEPEVTPPRDSMVKPSFSASGRRSGSIKGFQEVARSHSLLESCSIDGTMDDMDKSAGGEVDSSTEPAVASLQGRGRTRRVGRRRTHGDVGDARLADGTVGGGSESTGSRQARRRSVQASRRRRTLEADSDVKCPEGIDSGGLETKVDAGHQSSCPSDGKLAEGTDSGGLETMVDSGHQSSCPNSGSCINDESGGSLAESI